MYTKNKKNRIILCICSILVVFASIFAIIPFKKDTHIVKADTINESYSFVGSNLFFPITYYTSETGYDSIDNQFDINILSFDFSTDNTLNIVTNVTYNITFTDVNFGTVSKTLSKSDNTLDVSNDFRFYLFSSMVPGTTTVTNYYTGMNISFYKFDGTLNSNTILGKPYKVEFYGFYANTNKDRIAYRVKYYDINNNYIQFAWTKFFDYSITNPDYLLVERTYYLLSPDSFLSDNEFYQAGYDSGYDSGYLEGEISGSNSGYSAGYERGEDDGYALGYNQALENGSLYSFNNLISAVIDVPVRTFTSLFNFEILGVNLSGFFLGLLTCCFVIGVIRLIL